MPINDLIQKGDYQKALDKIEGPYSEWKKLDFQIKIYFYLRRYDILPDLIESFRSERSDIPWIKFKADLYEIDYIIKQGRNSEAADLIEKLDYDISSLDRKDGEELEILGFYYHLKGTLALIQGKYTHAEDLLLKAREYREDHIDTTALALTLNNLGVLFRRKGLLLEAIKYYQRSLDIFTKFENEQMMAMIRNNLGVLHSSRGELFHSKKYHEENLVFYTEKGDAEQVARSLNNLGSVYRDLGDFEYAEKLYVESIEFRQDGDNPQNLFASYYNLAICLIESGQLDRIDDYIFELEKLLDRNSNPRNKIQYEFVVALSYYKQKRLKSKIQAMQKFEKLAQVEEVDPDVTFQSIMMLIELLFFELTSLNNAELLDEISGYIDLLEKKTYETSHYLYYLKSKLLRAKLAMIIGDIEEAESIYKDALDIASKHHLIMYKQHIHEELENFREEIHKWVDLSEQQQSLIDRIRESMITDYLRDVKYLVDNSND